MFTCFDRTVELFRSAFHVPYTEIGYLSAVLVLKWVVIALQQRGANNYM